MEFFVWYAGSSQPTTITLWTFSSKKKNDKTKFPDFEPTEIARVSATFQNLLRHLRRTQTTIGFDKAHRIVLK